MSKMDDEPDAEILDSLVKRFDDQLSKNTAKVAAIEKREAAPEVLSGSKMQKKSELEDKLKSLEEQ